MLCKVTKHQGLQFTQKRLLYFDSFISFQSSYSGTLVCELNILTMLSEKTMSSIAIICGLLLCFISGTATGKAASKTAYAPVLPDDLGAPVEVIQIDDAPTCGQDCYGNDTCMSFAYDAENGTCMKYGGNYFGNFNKTSGKEPRKDIPLTAQPMYFFNLSHALDRKYILDRDAGLCYRMYSEVMNHTEAEALCSRDNSRLLAVQNLNQLNKIIASFQSTNFPMHVAGTGEGMTYFDTQPIPDSLFSTNGLNASGTCTHLTTSGLSNGNCHDRLFVACAY